MILMAHDQPTEVLKPDEQPFDLPATSIPPKRTTVLAGGLASAPAMRSDPLDVAFLGQSRIQRIAVIRFIPHDSLGQFVYLLAPISLAPHHVKCCHMTLPNLPSNGQAFSRKNDSMSGCWTFYRPHVPKSPRRPWFRRLFLAVLFTRLLH